MQALALEAGIDIRIHLIQRVGIIVQVYFCQQGKRPVPGFHTHRQPVFATRVGHGGIQLRCRQRWHARPFQGQAGIADRQQLLAVKQLEDTLQRRPGFRVTLAEHIQATQTNLAVFTAHQIQIHPAHTEFLKHQVPVPQGAKHINAEHHFIQHQWRLPFRGGQANLAGHELGHQAGHGAVQFGDGQRGLNAFFEEMLKALTVIRHQQHQLTAYHHIGSHQQ